MDSKKLRGYVRLDLRILGPITHRTVEQQRALTMIRARDVLGCLRTAVVNATRAWPNHAVIVWPRSLLVASRQVVLACFREDGAALEPLFERSRPGLT